MVRSTPTSEQESNQKFPLNPIAIGLIRSMYAGEAENIIAKMEKLKPDVRLIAERTLLGYQWAMNTNNMKFLEVVTDANKLSIDASNDEIQILEEAA